VPLIAPPADTVSPAGNDPEGTDHEYPPVPPVAASVWLYKVPTVPLGSEIVVILKGGAARVMLSALVAVVCELSFT
jgi:hypothetical protein